jgi:hypothetical protein
MATQPDGNEVQENIVYKRIVDAVKATTDNRFLLALGIFVAVLPASVFAAVSTGILVYVIGGKK